MTLTYDTEVRHYNCGCTVFLNKYETTIVPCEKNHCPVFSILSNYNVYPALEPQSRYSRKQLRARLDGEGFIEPGFVVLGVDKAAESE